MERKEEGQAEEDEDGGAEAMGSEWADFVSVPEKEWAERLIRRWQAGGLKGRPAQG